MAVVRAAGLATTVLWSPAVPNRRSVRRLATTTLPRPSYVSCPSSRPVLVSSHQRATTPSSDPSAASAVGSTASTTYASRWEYHCAFHPRNAYRAARRSIRSASAIRVDESDAM